VNFRPLLLAAAAALAADQGFKYLTVQVMDLSRVWAIDVLPPYLNLRYGENRGVNFGLFGDGSDVQRWVLIGISLLVMAGIVIWVARARAPLAMQISAGLLIGGAMGNVVDRVLHGYVLDFLNMSCCGINNPFVFNTADIFIFAGALGLVFLDGADKRKKAS
jgi:signal peptidase II